MATPHWRIGDVRIVCIVDTCLGEHGNQSDEQLTITHGTFSSASPPRASHAASGSTGARVSTAPFVPTFADTVGVVTDAGLVDTDCRITDEVRLQPTAGYTPGHVSVCTESRGACVHHRRYDPLSSAVGRARLGLQRRPLDNWSRVTGALHSRRRTNSPEGMPAAATDIVRLVSK